MFMVQYSETVQGHQSQMQNSIKLLKNEKLNLALNITLTSVVENHPMTKKKSLLIVTSKLFELESCKTSQNIGK